MTRIAMWSGPRNLSTAMMRSWEHRPDTEVLDEPLYAAYLAATGLDHPGRDEIIAAGPADFDDAVAACLSAPQAGAISYQKHMAHHLLPHVDRSWLGGLRNCLLLRDPRRVLASYTKVRDAVTLDDLGIPQQVELVEHCELVVDAADFLTRPTRLPDRDLSSPRCALRRRDDAVAGRAPPVRRRVGAVLVRVGGGVDRIRCAADGPAARALRGTRRRCGRSARHLPPLASRSPGAPDVRVIRRVDGVRPPGVAVGWTVVVATHDPEAARRADCVVLHRPRRRAGRRVDDRR